MALASQPCNDGLEINSWITSTQARFFEFRKMAYWTLPVSQTYCFAGIDPGDFYNVTAPSVTQLQNLLREIYVQHGPVDLLFRGSDGHGKWYLKCAQPGHKYGPAKAVICVFPPKIDKIRKAVARVKPRLPVVDGTVQDADDWEQVGYGVEVVEDDWVKV